MARSREQKVEVPEVVRQWLAENGRKGGEKTRELIRAGKRVMRPTQSARGSYRKKAA